MKTLKLFLILLTLMLASCINLPVSEKVIDSVEMLYYGDILLLEDYVELINTIYKDEELEKKKALADKHLRLSKEVNDYFQKLKTEQKGEDNGVE